MVHAIVLTLVRLVVTQRRLLEWETAAASAARSGESQGAGRRSFFVGDGSRARRRARPARHRRRSSAPLRAPSRRAPPRACGPPRRSSPAGSASPSRERRALLGDDDRDFLRRVARETWRYFDAFMGAEDHGLPPDNFQEAPEPRVAHRTSPTNIGMGLLATLAAHDLGFIPTAELVERIDATLTTMEGLERLEGPPPQLVRHADPRAAAAPLRLDRRQRQPRRRADRPRSWPQGLRRARRLAGGAPTRGPRRRGGLDRRRARRARRRHELPVPLRPPAPALLDRLSPRRRRGTRPLDPSYYDLLASEARLASFIAIAKGDVPQAHWFHLGRLVTSVHGAPVLLSWSATMFEYLMPLLVMRSYPDTLLDESCRMAVRRQIEYGAARGVPWGISESAYNVVDRHGTYQYKAFGVPGPRPEARPRRRARGRALRDRARGAVDPAGAAAREPAAARRGRAGRRVRLLRRDRLHAPRRRGGLRPAARHGSGRGRRARVHGAPPGHDPGRARERAARRSDGEALSRRPARAGHRAAAAGARAAPGADRAAAARRGDARRSARGRPLSARRFRSPHTAFPHAQFLSNGNYTAVVTNAGGGASFCRGRAVTRHRARTRPATRAASSSTCATCAAGAVWSATFQPMAKEPQDYLVTFLAEKATFAAATTTSPRSSTSRSPPRTTSRCAGWRSPTAAIARARSRSRATPRSCSRRRRTTSRIPPSASSSSRPSTCPTARRCSAIGGRAPPTSRRVGGARPEPRRPAAGARRMGDRPRALPGPRPRPGRSAGARRAARSPAPPAPCSTRSSACGSASASRPAASCACLSPRVWRRAARRPWRWRSGTTIPRAAARTFALAFTHAQSGLRHLGISSDEALLFERLASRVLYADGSLRARPELLARNTLGQAGLWAHGISGDLPILLVRVVEDDDLPLVRQVLQAQEYWRLKGLSADVVILNEHPVSYLDEMHAQLTALARQRAVADLEAPAGRRLPAARRMAWATRSARCSRASPAPVLQRRSRAALANQLDRPNPERSPRAAGPLVPSAPGPSPPRSRETPMPPLALAERASAASPTADATT